MQLQTTPVPVADPDETPVCCPIHLRAVAGMPRSKMGYVPLLTHKEPTALLAAFQAAPHFARVPIQQLFQQRRGGLRVIFLTESDYYARQAAAYLATLSCLEQQRKAPAEEDIWGELDSLFAEDDPPLQHGMLVLTPALLDPQTEERREQTVTVLRNSRETPFRLSQMEAPAVLLWSPSGQVLTPTVIETLAELLEQKGETDVFLALRPEQLDMAYLEELRFSHGFHVCQVGRPDSGYLCRFLTQTARELLCPLDSQIDHEQIFAALRRYRGTGFDETDIEKLVAWAVQRQTAPPLRTKDLLYTPFQEKKTGWKFLEEMVGLAEVKDALRRTLATAALYSRCPRGGVPFCRNMAFSGPPGTGKSVTARLTAQILREEGCGTGRFVEAGREQLIGSYLGQTSPMVAELFRRAKGGVLFIDEAGALLDGGRDIYAVEAVNALVRHMELETETMVIFATYAGEMEQLLTANPGLASRVAQVLCFPAYDDNALWEIFQSFARQESRVLPPEAETVCGGFFSRLRRQKGESFGNGREARRLYQAAVEEMALRVLSGESETLTPADLERAAERMLAWPDTKKTRPIGF